jgi:septin family protein
MKALEDPRKAKLSPFEPKSKKEKRLKILVYGESGSGKTRFALSLPKLAMIDTEGGTDHYDGDYSVL